MLAQPREISRSGGVRRQLTARAPTPVLAENETRPAIAEIAPSPADAAIEFSFITTRPDFDALEAEWNALFERAARSIHVFQSFNWCWHWCNSFLPAAGHSADRSPLFILTGRRDGRLVLVWPMVRQRRAGLVQVSFLGDPVSQYGDLIIEPLADVDAVLDQAFTRVREEAHADVMSFRRVRADANIAPLLERHGAIVTERLVAPYLDLASAPDFSTYEQRYSSKARKNRRRLLRRFEERAPAVLQSATTGTRASELADVAISLKRAWLKDRGLVSKALTNPATRQFFVTVARADVRPVGAVITSLETRGEPAAIEIGFDCKGRRAVHIIVYALKYERASAGQLLIESSIRNCYERGMTTYDLLAPGDDYKLDWADGSVEVCDRAIGTSAAGRIYAKLYLARGRKALKAAVTRTARAVRRLTAKKPKLLADAE